MAKDITGTANIAIGPGTPPLERPKTNTPKDAKNKKTGSINNYLRTFSAFNISLI